MERALQSRTWQHSLHDDEALDSSESHINPKHMQSVTVGPQPFSLLYQSSATRQCPIKICYVAVETTLRKLRRGDGRYTCSVSLESESNCQHEGPAQNDPFLCPDLVR